MIYYRNLHIFVPITQDLHLSLIKNYNQIYIIQILSREFFKLINRQISK